MWSSTPCSSAALRAAESLRAFRPTGLSDKTEHASESMISSMLLIYVPIAADNQPTDGIGAVLGRLGAVVGRHGSVLGPLGAVLGPLRAVLGLS